MTQTTPNPAEDVGDPRHVNQARAWHAALEAEKSVFGEPSVMRTGLTAALRKADDKTTS